MRILTVVIFSVGMVVGSFIPASAAETLQSCYEKGEAAYQRGDYKSAIHFFEQGVEINPNFAPLYNALGLAHQDQQDPVDDVAWFFKVAADIDPKYADPYNNLCRVYYQAGRHAEAEKACLKALEISPAMLSAQLSLAWVYLTGLQEPAKAVLYFNKVADRIENPMVYFGLGMAYAQNDERAMTLEIITRLRDMGETNLAVQLENAVRRPIIPEDLPSDAQALEFPQWQPGALIKATPNAQPANNPATPQINGTSTMQIRLRGTLTGLGPAEANGPGETPVDPHPGSLSQ